MRKLILASLLIAVVSGVPDPLVKLHQSMHIIPPPPPIILDGECSNTYLISSIASNSLSLGDSDLLLDTQTSVATLRDCAAACCTADCCKAVYTQDKQCKLYTYIKDSELPVPAGATVIKEKCCYDGEELMGDITLHITPKKSRPNAQNACAALGTTLAMPKTECAFKVIAKVADPKRNDTGNVIWIGVNNPSGYSYTFLDGDGLEEGFTFPNAPASHQDAIAGEIYGILYFDVNKWTVGDWTDEHLLSYICQSNTF